MQAIEIYSGEHFVLAIWCNSNKAIMRVMNGLKSPYQFRLTKRKYDVDSKQYVEGIWCTDIEKLRQLVTFKNYNAE